MELKNIIAAVTLSLAIIVLYSLFFQPSPGDLKKARTEKEKKELTESSEAPSLDETENFAKLSRKDAEELEEYVANKLRKERYGVWFN